MKNRKIRVIHYGLGPIGIETARYVLTKESMEIVGAVDISKDMVGRDLADLLGTGEPSGVIVTDNASNLLSRVPADVVIHTAGSRIKNIFPQLVEIIETGKNIVSSAEELLFPSEENVGLADQLNEMATNRGATILATGVNPGFVMDALPLFMTGACQDVKIIRVERIVDAATRRYPLQKKVGAGMTPEVFRAKVQEKAMGHVGLTESLRLVAFHTNMELDEIRETIDPVMTEKAVKTDYFELQPGDIAGIKNVALGMRGGEAVITLDLRMYIGAEDPHDAVYIDGTPPVNLHIDGGIAGDKATAAILVNSIPAVINSRPGLVTVKDLPSPHFEP
ncbi:MAG: dihydrodipicolinate reductase [Deltaproteobacteria bacterium]|nr:dihydrodipicolinate reductase [Deltaproteobacteria bacterium]